MMSAPLARASATSFCTLATELAQRGRRCALQVWLVKSITSSAVSLGSMVTGLSCGGAGSLAAVQSSTMVCAAAGSAPAPKLADASSAMIVERKRRMDFLPRYLVTELYQGAECLTRHAEVPARREGLEGWNGPGTPPLARLRRARAGALRGSPAGRGRTSG